MSRDSTGFRDGIQAKQPEYKSFYDMPATLLCKMRKSRRSPSASSSFGIRAPALDFQKDLEERRKERQAKYEKFVEESRKQMFEKLEEFEREEKRKKIERDEKEKKEKEEREKEEKMLREKELEKIEQEKSEGDAKSNDFSYSIDLNLQEPKEEFPKETSSIESQCSRKKFIDIIPSSLLHIQLTFGNEDREENEDKQLKSFAFSCENQATGFDSSLIEDPKDHNQYKGATIIVFEKKIDHELFTSQTLEMVSVSRTILLHNIWNNLDGDRSSSMLMLRVKFGCQRFVFDPGGHINHLDSRTNPFEEGGYDMNPKAQLEDQKGATLKTILN